MPTRIQVGGHVSRQPDGKRRSVRRATALLVCIFVMAITTVLVVSMIDTQTLQMTALRHTQQYERSLYLAGAAVHHALAQLEDDPNLSLPLSIGPIEFPTGSGNTYEALVTQNDDELWITATGTSGSISRHVRVTVTQ